MNPEGPNGKPDSLAAAKDIRTTFARMAMNDEETVALIAGGHTLGKNHGAGPASHVGPEPEAAPLEEQGFGWKSSYESGKGADAITSGLEGAWTPTPTLWSNSYLASLFAFEWELTKSPAGAHQWTPKDAPATAPDAHIDGKMNKIMMLTTDIALIKDPIYREISERFAKDADAFNDAFARAWYKLTHRDMGPHIRLLGPEVAPVQACQDPVPAVDYKLIDKTGALTNDFFVNLLDMSTEWKKSDTAEYLYEGHDRGTGKLKWTATSADLVFGSNSQLRALAEVYASDDGRQKFVEDFVAAWAKVMDLDRFELTVMARAGGEEPAGGM